MSEAATVKRLIECKTRTYPGGEVVVTGIYDVASLTSRQLNEQRENYSREFVYAADYDALRKECDRQESDLSRLRGEVARLEQEKADFYMAYRCECDIETKALHGEVARLKEEVEYQYKEVRRMRLGWLDAESRAEVAEARVQALQQALEDVLADWYLLAGDGVELKPPEFITRARAVLAGEAAPTQETQG